MRLLVVTLEKDRDIKKGWAKRALFPIIPITTTLNDTVPVLPDTSQAPPPAVPSVGLHELRALHAHIVNVRRGASQVMLLNFLDFFLARN